MQYPRPITPTNHIAPVPRRVRGSAGGRSVFDTTHATYVWEWPAYPQYYLPRHDVDMALLTAHGKPASTAQGTLQTYELEAAVGPAPMPPDSFSIRRYPNWSLWYVLGGRRSTTGSRKTKNSCIHAARTPEWMRCVPAEPSAWNATVRCSPSRRSWFRNGSFASGEKRQADIAWSYDFPTRQLLPIAGLVAFLNEQVDIFIDDIAQPRPVTRMT